MSTKEYLSFTKRERVGILTLVLLLIIIAILPHFIPARQPPVEHIPVAALQQKSVYRDSLRYRNYDTLRSDLYENRYGNGWKKKEWETRDGNTRPYSNYYPVRRMYNNDYRKSYYRDSSFQRRPFVNAEARGVYRSEKADYSPPRRREYSPVDVNMADTSAFIALPGIGSKLAARIILFRKKLGGFSSVEQLRQVYGLKDSVYTLLVPFLRCDSGYVVKDNLSYTTIR